MTPLISVLCCLRNRRDMFPRALACYESQTYPNKELVIIEDGEETVRDMIVARPDIIYVRFPARNLAAKRNAGVRFARGEWICHFDSDDWSGPNRLQDQLDFALKYQECPITGYGETYFWDEVTEQASLYKGPMWGATFFYFRNFALVREFPEKCDEAEDAAFLLRSARSWADQPARENMVSILHSENRKVYGVNEMWPIVPYDELPILFRQEKENGRWITENTATP